MAITMEKIKFYHPPSLPVRPTQKCPANRPSPLYCHSPNRSYFSIPTPQHCPLPPRPPVTIPPSTTARPGNTSRPLSSPVYANDFDLAMQDFPQESADDITYSEDRKDEEREDPLILDSQANGGNLLCGTPSSKRCPSSLAASSTLPTTDNTLAQSLHADLAQPQNYEHESSEIRTSNIEPMSPTRSITSSIPSEELVSTSVSTNLHQKDAILGFPTPGPIFTSEGETERHKKGHKSVVLDSQDLESSVQSTPHNEEAHKRGTSMISEQGTTCQPDEPVTVQGNETITVSSLPSIAVVMPVSSRSPTTSSKRPLLSNQFDLEPLLLEDDNHSIPSDDEDDEDYIDDDKVPEADQRLPASKRRKINSSARSSPAWRETRLSKKMCESEPVQQDLGQAVKHHQTSPAPSVDVYCFTGLLSYLSRMPIEDRLQFVSWFCEGALTQIMPDPSLALSPTPASTAERSRKSGWSSSKPRENKPWKPEEKALLRQLKKEEQLSWSAIEKRFAEKFPERRIGAIQVHWYTKLRDEH